jgi:hypothetical protein
LTLAGALGLSPDERFNEHKGGGAVLFDREGRFLQQATTGSTGETRIDIVEAINQRLGMFNTQGMSVSDQYTLFLLAGCWAV